MLWDLTDLVKVRNLRMIIKSYSELQSIDSFMGRFEYLKLNDKRVGEETFGCNRYLNQIFYKSSDWLRVRDFVIVRDNGCDLGMRDRPIVGPIMVHHINPITKEDLLNQSPKLFDPNNLICCSKLTHDQIHYGDGSMLIQDQPLERYENDTIPWRI